MKEGTLPNLLIIGVQKGGTTWLHNYLGGHSCVGMSAKKELEYFSKYKQPLQEYKANFQNMGEKKIVGESTPGYLWSPHASSSEVISRIRKTLKDEVKILVSLRDPVDRAISAFMHHWKQGRVGVDASILTIGHGILEASMYRARLEPWIKEFEEHEIFFIRMQDLFSGSNALTELSKWLNLDVEDFPNLSPLHVGAEVIEEDNFLTISDQSFDKFKRGNEKLTEKPKIYESEIQYLSSSLAAEIDYCKSIFPDGLIKSDWKKYFK